VAGVLSGRGPVWLGWRWEACPNGLKIAQLQPVTVLTINIYHTYIIIIIIVIMINHNK
jgi:hypothetical protein